jgi:predicted metal-binding membrane protein
MNGMAGMHDTSMTGMTMPLPLFIVMMAAMMLPSARVSGALLIGAGDRRPRPRHRRSLIIKRRSP